MLALASSSSALRGIRKRDIQAGDTVLVRTRNSLYAMVLLDSGEFAVRGGWFEANGEPSVEVAVNGCTWGGHAILTDMVAAPGLFLEFANGVRTTRILAVGVLHGRASAMFN